MSMRGYWAIPVLASILILGTFSFTIPPSFADPDFDSMRAAIEALGLPVGTENSLISKINAAQKQFENGNDEAATNILDAFKNYVNAQSGKNIDSIDADSLIDSVQEIIDEILGVAPPACDPSAGNALTRTHLQNAKTDSTTGKVIVKYALKNNNDCTLTFAQGFKSVSGGTILNIDLFEQVLGPLEEIEVAAEVKAPVSGNFVITWTYFNQVSLVDDTLVGGDCSADPPCPTSGRFIGRIVGS